MENNNCNIHVLLQAAEYLDRREREAEHGYASLQPLTSRGLSDKRHKPKTRKNPDNVRSVHNELEKHRRAQLRHCLDLLKEQVPLSSDSVRNTTLNLLRRARVHIKKLQEQDEQAERLKDRLRWEQRGLRGRLEQLLGGAERTRSDSLGSALSSERSDSDREDVEIDVESTLFVCVESENLGATQAEGDHSYSTVGRAWL
ncbi:max dimerization protein 3 [Lepisosteus oculatus]|uniref:max dimerization protein 3 n=1 Tax=Lepisosteus oculatus TaxID=7918 RepID=UPI0035F51A12